MTSPRSLSIAAAVTVVLGVAPLASLGAQVSCDTLQTRARLAALGGYDRPFTGDSAAGEVVGRPRHEVLAPAGRRRGTARTGGTARNRRVGSSAAGAVVKDAPGLVVRKEQAHQGATCPRLAALPGAGAGEVPPPVAAAPYPVTETAPGEVLPSPPGLPGSVVRPRGGWLSLPPILGGLLLGGAAVALGDRSAPGTTPVTLTPGTPGTPVAPGAPTTPTVPGAPAVPGTPPTPAAPATPGTPLGPGAPAPGMPTLPGAPLAPPSVPLPNVPSTVAPEPSSVVLVALGSVVLAVGRRRRRR